MYNWKVNVELEGLTPMLIHNGRTASPLDEFAKKMKAITSIKKKTEEDIKKLLMVQFEAALYWDEEIGLHMPTENLMAALLKAARRHKLGKEIAGFVFEEPIGFPIITKNHTDYQGLLNDEENKFIKAVTVKTSKTISCRPIFHNWSLNFKFYVDEEILNLDQIKMILGTFASRIGLGVWTPSNSKPGTYGKFLIKKLVFKNEKTGEEKVYDAGIDQ